MEVIRLNSLLSVFIFVFTLLKTGQVTSTFIEKSIKVTNLTNCQLNFSSEKEQLYFNKTIETNRLIKLSVNLIWTNISVNGSQNNSDIVKQTWYIAKEDAGKNLLLLDDQFEVMSLGILSMKVSDMYLTLKQIPDNCLSEQSEVHAMETLFIFLLKSSTDNHYRESSAAEGELTVCNGTIGRNGSCCSLDDYDTLSCDKLKGNSWTKAVDTIVIIFSVILINQIPRLVPKKLYMLQDLYSQRKELKSPIKLNTEMSMNMIHRRCVVIRGEASFEHCKSRIRDRQYRNALVKSIYLYVDESRFESEACATKGFLDTFYDLIQIFKDMFCGSSHEDFDGMKECCYYDVCFKLWRALMYSLYVFLFMLPILLRLLFIIKYDSNLVIYSVSLGTNFVVLLFCLVPSESEEYRRGIQKYMKQVMETDFQNELNNARDSIHDMFIKSDRLIFRKRGSWMSLLMQWIKTLLFIIPFSITAIIVKLFIVGLPLLHFILRGPCYLTGTLFVTSLGIGNKLRFPCKHLLYILDLFPLVCLLALTTSFLLVLYVYLDLSMFIIKCVLYMALGFLQYFEDILAYISFFLLISTLIVQCFRKVNIKISHFNKKVFEIIGNSLEPVDSLNGTILVKRDGLFFKTKELFYFYKVGKDDRQKYLFLSKAFLNHLSAVRSPLTPGSRNWLYYTAFLEIGLLFVLLLLVVIIIVSYGNALDLSTGMKALITLGSGALLFLFNNFLIKSVSHSMLENNELLHNFVLSYIPNDFEEIWKVYDFGDFETDHTAGNAYLNCALVTNRSCCYNGDGIQFYISELSNNSGEETTCDIFCGVLGIKRDEMGEYQMENETNERSPLLNRF